MLEVGNRGVDGDLAVVLVLVEIGGGVGVVAGGPSVEGGSVG